MSLRVFSTFSGISAATVAWKPLGFEFVGFAEIEPFPCHVLAERCGASRPLYMPLPDEPGIDDKERKVRLKRIKDTRNLPAEGIPNFGDISQVTDADLKALGPVDVLEGGSPCQGFAFSGLRAGMNDNRSNLLLQFCNLAHRMRRINGTRYVLWENVPGVLSDRTNGFGCLLGSLAGENGPLQSPGRRWTNAGNVLGPKASISWRVFDAQFFRGTPQRRRRVFAFADFGDRSGASGAVLFESKSERRDHPASGHAEQGAANRRAAGVDRVIALGMDSKDSIAIDQMHCLKASNEHNPPAVAYALCDDYTPKAAPGTAFTLLSGSPTGGGHKQMVVHQTDEVRRDWIVRRLMPIEAERLQGFPDDWTDVPFRGKPVIDGPRYKSLGNSMAVPCMAFIGNRLRAYHREQVADNRLTCQSSTSFDCYRDQETRFAEVA